VIDPRLSCGIEKGGQVDPIDSGIRVNEGNPEARLLDSVNARDCYSRIVQAAESEIRAQTSRRGSQLSRTKSGYDNRSRPARKSRRRRRFALESTLDSSISRFRS